MGIWNIFKKKKSNTLSPDMTPAVPEDDHSKTTNRNEKRMKLTQEVQEIVKTRRLRPLGNRDRLTHTDDDTYDVRLLLFNDLCSAETYYSTLLKNARQTPPPCLMEIMVVHLPRSIYDEKYAVVMPSERTDNRPAYCTWALNAIRTANETLRVHNSTDHKYKELYDYVAKVYAWDILLPGDFDPRSPESRLLLSDPLGGGFNMVNWTDPNAPPPVKVEPNGPWIGVLIEQKQFAEALNEKTGTALCIKRVGAQNLLGSIIHGAQVTHPEPCWCVAIHTDSEQQATQISIRVKELNEKEYLTFFQSEIVREPALNLSGMTYLGFISEDGQYREENGTQS